MAEAIVLVEDNVEDLEFFYPKIRLEELGLEVVVVSSRPRGRGIAGFVENGSVTKGGPCETKHGYAVDAIGASDVDVRYLTDRTDVLIIPGGNAPEALRQSKEILEITRTMVNAGKIVGAICHGPLVLISAGVISGRTVTSWPGIRDDVENAGAGWIDRPVVRDGKIVTSRNPGDLPDFMRAIVAMYRAHLGFSVIEHES